ncbi:MAG: DUF885 domain-containing protein, partial [Acidimicrobiales bacterium]
MTSRTARSGAETVDAVADAYVDGFAALDPLAATRLGIPGHDAEMTDFGPAGVEARAELARRALA